MFPEKRPSRWVIQHLLPIFPHIVIFMSRCVQTVMLSAFAAPELNVPPAGVFKNHCPSNSNVHFWQSENGERYLNLGSHCHREHWSSVRSWGLWCFIPPCHSSRPPGWVIIWVLDHHCSSQAICRHRMVKCPGLDCPSRVPLTRLKEHALACCVERAEIKPHPLPHRSVHGVSDKLCFGRASLLISAIKWCNTRFTYMMNEDAQSLSNESQNFMWRLEGIRFQEETFFLKVSMTEIRPNCCKSASNFTLFCRWQGKHALAAGSSLSR